MCLRFSLLNDSLIQYFPLCSSADHPLTQFLRQYQYHVYRKLAPLVKDVGFPDVKSVRKAKSKEADIILNESHSDEQTVKTKSDTHREDGEEDSQNTNSLKNVEGNLESLPSEYDDKESVTKGVNAIVDENVEEKRHDDVDQPEVTSEDDEKNGDIEKGANVDKECASSGTDLEKLKNLLEDDLQAKTFNTDTEQVVDSVDGEEPSAIAVVDESENLESYFDELEDDMFGWESDEVDNNGTGNETANANSCRGTTDENEPVESKEESVEKNTEQHETKVVEESTDANGEALSCQLDSLGDEDAHLRPCSDSTSIENIHSPDEIDASTREDLEAQNVITNDRDCLSQPRDDTNPLEEKESASGPVEQRTSEQTTSDHTNGEGEAQQTRDNLDTRETPTEETLGDQENEQIPKQPSFASEEGINIKEQDAVIPVPATDEVRKQLKDALVDVRFFLGEYIKLMVFGDSFVVPTFVFVRVGGLT